ncbi:MAG: thiol-disulfide isomerase [Pseudohongiella sp.]|nr:MAG: thiol-disulfide isomerase [Pseudohongiella sp.]
MKKSLGLALVAALISSTVTAGERVGDFALIDHQGAIQHMAWYNDQSAVVIVPMKDSQDDVSSLKALQQKYTGQNVQFFLLNPGLHTDRAQVASEVAVLGLDLPVLMDDAQLVTEMLGVSRLDEAVLYNPNSFEILYRGPVASMESSLEQLVAGENFELVTVASSGAAIEFTNLDAHANLSYEKDIAPIIAENCANCHRDGGIAPFAMDSNLAVQGWSPMIREVVMTKRMPPGQVDNKVGHKMKNEMNLSDDEMQKLVRWVNNGSKVDSENDPLTELTWPSSKWSLGEPDLIVKVPEQSIPATGVVDYMDIPVDLGLEKDVWIKGSEVAPGDPAVLHHIITTVIPPEGAPDFQQILMDLLATLPPEQAQSIRAKLFAAVAAGEQPNITEIFNEVPEFDIGVFLGGGSDPDLGSVAGYAPGNNISLNPPGVGGLLKAGTTLNLQMHYTTSGKETTDATEIGIYFYDEGEVPKERMSGGVGNDFAISIPPQAKDHEMQLVTLVPEDAEIYSLMPHMHFRGKRMKFTAQYPDGSEELLLSVPAYSFNWQLAHELEEPLRVPAGTKIVATGAFDNSSQNTFNPDPNSEINWGEQSWEEMFMGFYTWKNVDQGGSD